jgi:hypothetical protein
MDRLVREDPEGAYEPAFYERLVEAAKWRLGGAQPAEERPGLIL